MQAQTHMTNVSLRQIPGVHQLGLDLPPAQFLESFPFTAPLGSGCLCSPHHSLQIVTILPTIQASYNTRHCKTRALALSLFFLPLHPYTQAKSILPPLDYHESFTHCHFSISHITLYFRCLPVSLPQLDCDLI